ncbi:N-acetylmuramoyl-L-alanine amidase [Streptomyces sp. AK08-02]|uniref:peptidoglycan recognition protein family protein n=1 Tax=Streptomyces sp. AK08-02 TaxID=3028654 RepID=UPI0029A0B578|nr:N-acetylmuramoyl-L-alanine amidase [Streptomyces sp. AK08-02]MDX3747443.1 N-acetylmuramoyl-L-alanine amidase [Streptomyces sp. AK08-02]
MAWYPGATRLELQPESDDQPAIRPTQLIVHSLAATWTAQRTYEYWHDSTNLESHFGLGYAGDLAQYVGTETRADANAAANLRPDGTGAISIETASNLHATDPWTDEQVEKLIRVGVWAHQHPAHAIPLRLCRSADDPGFGWHAQYSAWNPNGHACPGPARIKQFREVVFPGIVARAAGTTTPEEDDVPLTDAEINKIAKASAKENWAYLLDSPTAAEGTNPARTAGTFLRFGDAKYAATTAQIGALQGAVTALTAAVGGAGGITAEQIQAAAEAGANAALDRLGDALTEGN